MRPFQYPLMAAMAVDQLFSYNDHEGDTCSTSNLNKSAINHYRRTNKRINEPTNRPTDQPPEQPRIILQANGVTQSVDSKCAHEQCVSPDGVGSATDSDSTIKLYQEHIYLYTYPLCRSLRQPSPCLQHPPSPCLFHLSCITKCLHIAGVLLVTVSSSAQQMSLRAHRCCRSLSEGTPCVPYTLVKRTF
jgi:hypothetical protein